MAKAAPAHIPASQPESGTFHHSPELLSAMADSLADMLVAEYKRRHSKEVCGVTVITPGGFDHADNEGRNNGA